MYSGGVERGEQQGQWELARQQEREEKQPQEVWEQEEIQPVCHKQHQWQEAGPRRETRDPLDKALSFEYSGTLRLMGRHFGGFPQAAVWGRVWRAMHGLEEPHQEVIILTSTNVCMHRQELKDRLCSRKADHFKQNQMWLVATCFEVKLHGSAIVMVS